MPIAISDKIIALLASLSPEDVAALPPADRRRFADWCHRAARLAELAEPRPETHKTGVLSQLRDGRPG